MKHITLVLTALAVPALASAAGDLSVDNKVKWMQTHAAPVRSVDMGEEDFSDLMPLAQAIGDARIVQLGEATHGDGTVFLAKNRIIRFLHEKMGFDVLLWESSMLGCRLMDAGMRDPNVSAFDAANNNIFSIWSQSVQVQPLLEYVKRSQTTTRPIVTAGVDCRLGYQGLKEKTVPQYLVDFFDRVDPSVLTPSEREEIFKICKTVEYSDYYYKPGKRDLNMSVMTDLVAYLDKQPAQVRKHASAEEAGFVRQLLVSEISYEKSCDETGQGIKMPRITRDMIMGDNLVWQATKAFPDRKIIVWAHNFHIMESLYINNTAEQFERFEATNAEKGPMGHVAHRRLGPEVYSIGFIGNEGSYKLANTNEPAEKIPPAPEGTLDWYMNQVNSPHSFLDLQGLPQDHWLRQPIEGRFYFWGAVPSLWPRVFDGVFFSKIIEPSAKRADDGK